MWNFQLKKTKMTGKQGANKATKVTIGLIVLCLLLYAGFWLAYYSSMQGANAKANVSKCSEEQEVTFEGVVSRINRYEYSSHMNKNFFGVVIKTTDSTNNFIYWQFGFPGHQEILTVISPGQRVVKARGSKSFTLFVTKDIKKEFAIPFCN
jgi:cbb3-type cytochrome oxidase subunit 3